MSLPTVVFPAATGQSIAITTVPSVIPPAALDFRAAQVPDRPDADHLDPRDLAAAGRAARLPGHAPPVHARPVPVAAPLVIWGVPPPAPRLAATPRAAAPARPPSGHARHREAGCRVESAPPACEPVVAPGS